MIDRIITTILLGFLLSGCTASGVVPTELTSEAAIQDNPMTLELHDIPRFGGLTGVGESEAKPMTIGVYSFQDKTGQRKPADNVANLSSAVTQGSESWVIDALLEVGEGTWFEVVERVGMDNLVKERQLIRSTRDNYEQNPAQLAPMKFAGIILEGGIVGYDSNIRTGGLGAKYFGVGTSAEYREDSVTVAMRLVSVSTGRVLLSVASEKNIASYRSGVDAFKFLDLGTKILEVETGYSVNEPTNYAVRAAIESAVIELIYEGVRKDLWKFKEGKN
jgi:curli production assembly/transport component CsgG